jgi:RNA polymerase sigma-70 factor (ECF subfamily)
LPAQLPEAVEDRRAAELLARFAGGDQGAFEQLVRDHQDTAFGFARRIVGDAELARDVVQEAFIRVLRHHARFEAGRSFRTWLLHIVRNLAIDGLRRRRPNANIEYLDHLAQVERGGSSSGERDELRQRVAAVLQQLPEKYREILVMREMDGMPAEEIAQVIAVDYGTTRWRLHQARKLFREAWLQRWPEDQP